MTTVLQVSRSWQEYAMSIPGIEVGKEENQPHEGMDQQFCYLVLTIVYE